MAILFPSLQDVKHAPYLFTKLGNQMDAHLCSIEDVDVTIKNDQVSFTIKHSLSFETAFKKFGPGLECSVSFLGVLYPLANLVLNPTCVFAASRLSQAKLVEDVYGKMSALLPLSGQKVAAPAPPPFPVPPQQASHPTAQPVQPKAAPRGIIVTMQALRYKYRGSFSIIQTACHFSGLALALDVAWNNVLSDADCKHLTRDLNNAWFNGDLLEVLKLIDHIAQAFGALTNEGDEFRQDCMSVLTNMPGKHQPLTQQLGRAMRAPVWDGSPWDGVDDPVKEESDSWGIGKEYKAPKKEYVPDNGDELDKDALWDAVKSAGVR